MPDFSWGGTLSAHEILRFSVEQAGMRLRHVALYHNRVIISLRDHAQERNLWEIVRTEDSIRLTRYPKLRQSRVKGLFGTRAVGSITGDLSRRIIATHQAALVAMIRNDIARLVEARDAETRIDQQGILDARLHETRQVAAWLLPDDFS